LLLVVISTSGGCPPPPNPNAILTPPCYGPIKSLDEVVDAVNTNNKKVPTLWASHYYEANIVDDQKKSHFVNGDGVLLYRSPNDLRLQGSKDLIGPVFDLGTNSENYWMSVVPELDTLWYGNFADIAGASDRYQIPIQPEMVLQVLGIGPVDDNFNNLPAPTLRFNNDACAYMVVWNTKLPDRWIAQREVWYDYKTLRPIRVFLFDVGGSVVMRGILSDHRQVEVPGLQKESWPWIPGKYSLFFPANGTKMEFTLKDVMLQKGIGPRTVPNDRSFQRPSIGATHEIQIR
jgi:hypothetical protein